MGFGLSTIVTIKRESDLLVEQSKTAARRLMATVVASIETAMLQERPDITRGLIQDLKSSSPVEGITVYRTTAPSRPGSTARSRDGGALSAADADAGRSAAAQQSRHSKDVTVTR